RQVVEEQLHEFFARQGEGEAVLALALATLVAAAVAVAAALRAPDPVPGVELVIARMDRFAVTAGAMAEGGLGDVLDGNLDVAAPVHVLDRALGDHVGHRMLDMALVAPDEALAVDRALLAIVQ